MRWNDSPQMIIGRTGDKSFELLLNDIVEWFIENPLPVWHQTLTNSSRIINQTTYRY
jgi:hypothetical protein